jgi:hypothetical protein
MNTGPNEVKSHPNTQKRQKFWVTILVQKNSVSSSIHAVFQFWVKKNAIKTTIPQHIPAYTRVATYMPKNTYTILIKNRRIFLAQQLQRVRRYPVLFDVFFTQTLITA